MHYVIEATLDYNGTITKQLVPLSCSEGECYASIFEVMVSDNVNTDGSFYYYRDQDGNNYEIYMEYIKRIQINVDPNNIKDLTLTYVEVEKVGDLKIIVDGVTYHEGTYRYQTYISVSLEETDDFYGLIFTIYPAAEPGHMPGEAIVVRVEVERGLTFKLYDGWYLESIDGLEINLTSRN
jgi:hypothetical protein